MAVVRDIEPWDELLAAGREDERLVMQTAQNRRPGKAVEDERPGIQYGETGEDWITADFTYRFALDEGLALTGSIANMFDRDPPPAQEEFGYDPWTANPLGRMFELGIRKTF